ncbi:hypothetical protein DUNSADRAFT_7467, partial [Dunaliella salina]
MLSYLVSTCLCESVALVYSLSIRANETNYKIYLVYVWFWHMSSATFLMLLLALSSGYNITRYTLDGHRLKVILIPSIVFIAGVASDFTFVYIKSTQPLSTAADRYDIVEMTPWESAVWAIGSIANIMCFILAWVYVFDSIQLEIKELDDAQEAFKAANQPGGPPQPISPHAALLGGLPSSSQPPRDVEANAQRESVADRIEYTQRKKLLTLFYYGVCSYLVASILVILLPAFFINIVQNVLVVLQLIVKWVFTVVLIYIFRPARDSLYLQIGVSENDAEEQGLSQLDTELTITDTGRQDGRYNKSSGIQQRGGSGSAGNAYAGAPAAGAPASKQPPGQPRFTIGEDED